MGWPSAARATSCGGGQPGTGYLDTGCQLAPSLAGVEMFVIVRHATGEPSGGVPLPPSGTLVPVYSASAEALPYLTAVASLAVKASKAATAIRFTEFQWRESPRP